jgi:hypothetical protein
VRRADIMAKYTVHLRYYPGDPLEEIRQKDLDRIGRDYGVEVSFERIDNRTLSDGMLREETLEKAIEEITQDVITVSSEDEERFRKAITAMYAKYRSPRTPYSFWGSSLDGERIAKAIADETGGGW